MATHHRLDSTPTSRKAKQKDERGIVNSERNVKLDKQANAIATTVSVRPDGKLMAD